VSLRKTLSKVQLLVGLPAPKELASHYFSSFSYLSAVWQIKKDLQVLLAIRADKVVPRLLFGFKNIVSLAISWRRVATATHRT